MNKVKTSSLSTPIVLLIAFILTGQTKMARGQSTPNVQITSPDDGSTVHVGPGSSQLLVKAKFNNNFLPDNAELIYLSELHHTNNNWSFISPTGEFSTLLSVPPGTSSYVRVIVNGFKPASSDGQPRQESQEHVITTTAKQ